MYIKEIISQHRRDFTAIYKCEHCGHEEESYGYDDAFFHASVIPNMTCKSCEKKAGKDYVPMKTRYPEGYVV